MPAQTNIIKTMPENPPILTVIVPAYNAARYIPQLIQGLKSAWNDQFELIVIDDASTDNTARLITKNWASHGNLQLITIDKKSGPSEARNIGATHANANILAFIDADVMVHIDTLTQLHDHLQQNPDTSAVFGSYDDSPTDQHTVSQFKNLMHHYVHQQGSPRAQTFWTGCGAIRRQVFETIGPFREVNTQCVEDIDYGHRLRDSGHKITLQPKIQCTHLKRWTLPNLIKTDVLKRGVPWTVMMLRRRKIDTDLNLGKSHQLITAAAIGIGISIIALLFLGILDLLKVITGGGILWGNFFAHWWTWCLSASIILGLISLAAFLFLQKPFLGFLRKRRGWKFATIAAALSLLYYWYSLFAASLGISVFLTNKILPSNP